MPNNGFSVVMLPNIIAAACRIMIKLTGNIYYAVNSTPFQISTTLGTNDIFFDEFALYPNPNNGNFTISFHSKSKNEIKIKLNDASGKLIYANGYKNKGNFKKNFQLKNLISGTYLISVEDGETKMMKKISVKK